MYKPTQKQLQKVTNALLVAVASVGLISTSALAQSSPDDSALQTSQAQHSSLNQLSLQEQDANLNSEQSLELNGHMNSSAEVRYEVQPGFDVHDELTSEQFASSVPAVPEVLPLAWAGKVTDSFKWSEFTLKAISVYGTALSNGARDVQSFCPAYPHLNEAQKLNFWAQLISAMSQFESGFKPTSHFRESSMGTDHVTGQHVYSDGLLQLSYQDSQTYKFCDEFDWGHDRKLSEKDPAKTIFDPYINLRCGIRILNAEIARYGMISYRNGQYWSTLWPNHAAKVKAITRKIPYCASK